MLSRFRCTATICGSPHAKGALQDPAWHEIFAVVRSICINVRQAAISAEAGLPYLLAGGDENPMVPIVEGWVAAHGG